jgi:hypothetical protein
MQSNRLHGQYLDLCEQSRRPSKTYRNGTPMIVGTRPFLKTKEMQIQQNDNEIPWTYYSGRKTVMDLVKLSGIRDWPTLNMVKQVRGFLKFANFY